MCSTQECALLVLLATLPCCAEKVHGRVFIDDKQYDLQVKECSVVGSQEGMTVYTLNIEFEDPSRTICNSIRFTVQAPNNAMDNLLTEGTHAATGAQLDGILYNLLESCNAYYHNRVTSAEMEIVWEQLSRHTIAPDISYYTGGGHIRIKKAIRVSFPTFPHTYPEQQINFSCERVIIQ